MYLTWLDNNTWLWEISGKRILVDPWLVGTLVFLKAPWFFEGTNPKPYPIPDNIDLILLSQGLPDHAHPPTLGQMDRSIPVVCSPNAVSVVQNLGYEQVTELPHGETYVLDQAIAIQAVPGAAIGPFLTENGYVLTDMATGLTLYYEPHGFPADTLDVLAPIDVVITPVVDLKIPGVGAIIQGRQTLMEIAKRLQPQVMLPTTEGGDVQYRGLLAALLHRDGSAAAAAQQVSQAQPSTQFKLIRPGDRIPITLTPRRASAAA